MKYLRLFVRLLLFAALAFTAFAIIIYPERYISCCLQGFLLWAECVLPSLFPFMVISMIFIKTGAAEKAALPLKRITGFFSLPPAAAVCFLISICSGYPAGSRAVAEFYEDGSITERDAGKLAALCSTSGPLFVIGSVGVKMFCDKSAGWKILLAHALSVIAVALILSLVSKKENTRKLKHGVHDKNVLYNAFYGSVTAVLVAGGFIAFFCVAAQIAYDFNLLYPLEQLLCLFTNKDAASAVCRGIIEVTAGCRALSACTEKLALPFAGFLITFGGISIILQQLCYLVKAKVKPIKFILVKLVQAALCFALLLLF